MHRNTGRNRRKSRILFSSVFSTRKTVALEYSWYKISKTDLETLWNIWVKSPRDLYDQEFFFAFLRKVVAYGCLTDYAKSMDDAVAFFAEAICDETNNYSALSVDGMHTIESFMISVNKFLGNLGSSAKVESQFSTAGANLESEFEVRVAPENLKGLSILWKIALEAKNENVAVLAIEALNKFHTRLDLRLEDQVVQISTKFIETAAEKLAMFRSNNSVFPESRGKEIIKLLKLIQEMIDESERKGGGGLTPLYALRKSRGIRLKIVNKFNSSSGDPEFELGVSSTVTCWQLKTLIGLKLRIPPDSVLMTLREL